METTKPTPPPPPPPAVPAPPSAPATPHRPSRWWRRPLADLVDVVLVLLIGILAGIGAAATFHDDSDPWSGLVALLIGLAAAVVVSFIAWVVLLVRVGRGRPTSGERLLRLEATGRPLATAGRHIALVVAHWGTGLAAVGLVEPPPAGPAGSAVGAAVAAAALVLAHGWGRRETRAGIVAGALVVGGVLAGAVPDRPPHPWELHADATAAVVTGLEELPGATRDCALHGTGGVPQASHVTAECYDPDRLWTVDRGPASTVAHLVAVTDEAVGEHATVRAVPTHDGDHVEVDGRVVALVLALPDCTSRVVVAQYHYEPDAAPRGTCG